MTVVDETTAAPAVDRLRIGEVAASASASDDTVVREVVFDIRDLTVSYSGSVALRNATLEVRKNAVTAFIGPSGCGKSTFIRCLNRMTLLLDLPETTLVCTHREVFEKLLGWDAPCDKGAAWVLERNGSELVPALYLEAPSDVRTGQRQAV